MSTRQIRCILFLMVFCGISLLSAQSLTSNKQVWQQGVRYQIEAELDTTAKRLNGFLRVFYQNNSPDTLTKIYLQVPANAYHEEENTAVKEMKRFSDGNVNFDMGTNYKLTIQSLQFLSIGKRKSFPLQAYDFSDTILDLTLPFVLFPGDTLVLGLSFYQEFIKAGSDSQKVRIPTDFVLWFPRLTVYDEEGWHAEPFHFMMESGDVYSEFAEMDVVLTVPGNFIVVGSGEIVEGAPGWQTVTADTSMGEDTFKAWQDSIRQLLTEQGLHNGPRSVRFHADKLHNFIWSASPKFVHYTYKSKIPMHIFYRGVRHKRWLTNILQNIDKVFYILEEHFGAYPFNHLNIVKASRHTASQPMMARFHDSEQFEITYELTNIYFPGMVASNGVKEAWLAKGLQIYMGKLISEQTFGKQGYDLSEAREEMNWLERQYPLPSFDNILRNITRMYMESGQNEPISKAIHEYKDPIGALSNVYLKSEIFYEMLRFVVGDSIFRASTREVVNRYAFHHIKETDLMAVFEDVSGQDLDWFFKQWLHATPTVDYTKGKVKKYKRDDDTWVTEVELKRKGDGIMPVDVELDVGKNQKLIKRWDGKEKTGTVVFETAEKPKDVKVDPEDRIMDSNRLNNQRPRLEFRPDLPLLKFIHMPADAILVLWRPLIDYNKHDSIRLGFRTSSSYRAFYNNLTLEVIFGVDSRELDGKIAYSHPLNRKSLLNRYNLMVRKNEGRFEADVHVSFKGSEGILASSGRNIEIGLNYSDLLNDAYTFRKVANDSGKYRFEEWEDRNILLAYAEGNLQLHFGEMANNARFRFESALPGGDSRFTKLSGRLETGYQRFGITVNARGNLATSFGPDRPPLQDQLRAEGANPRERFQNDVVKTGSGITSFTRRYVEGGGFLQGYAGQPLPAESFATVNLELGHSRAFYIFKLFGFYDSGRIWHVGNKTAITRSDAGFGIKFFGEGLNLFGGNLGLFSNLSAKLFFPIWLSDPPPGEKRRQFRWYFSIGKGL